MSLAPRIDKLEYVNIRTSEGAGTTTLTISDSKHQVFNLSAARTVVLPSTGILSGEKVVIENRGAFDLTIQSSDLTTLNRTNMATGSLADPTIAIGKVTLIATQNTPTASTHWLVYDLYEEGSFSALFPTTNPGWNANVTINCYYKRINKFHTIWTQQDLVGTTQGTPTSISTAAGVVPSRLCMPATPANDHNAKCYVPIITGGTLQSTLGMVEISVTGSITLQRDAASNAFDTGATRGCQNGWNMFFAIV